MSPRLRHFLWKIQVAMDPAREIERRVRVDRDRAHESLRWLVHEVYESTGRLSMGADLVTEQDRLLQAAGVAEQALPIPLRYDPDRDAEVLRLLDLDATTRAEGDDRADL